MNVTKTGIKKEWLESKSMRKKIAKTSFLGFCCIYLSHYLTLERASFHDEMVRNLSDPDIDKLGIMGFRDSAKSTFGVTALPLWASIFNYYNFIVIIKETTDVANIEIDNLTNELKYNDLLVNDFPNLFKEDEFKVRNNNKNIILSTGTRIMGISRGQKIRGLKHIQHRPDLVILDDPEDFERVQKSRDYRNSTESWFNSNVLPAVDQFNSKLVAIGNLLHKNSLMPRIKEKDSFKFLEYPLIDEDGNITWKAKYPTKQDVEDKKDEVGKVAFYREYLLKIIAGDDQIIKPQWIDKVKRAMLARLDITSVSIGVDLGISKDDSADFTAIVPIISGWLGDGKHHFVMKPVNERMTFNETKNRLGSQYTIYKKYAMPRFFVEDAAYQKAMVQELERTSYPVKGINPGSDKESRLKAVSDPVEAGNVHFVGESDEMDYLEDQLLNFGDEDHDDLADAFVYGIFGAIQHTAASSEVTKIV